MQIQRTIEQLEARRLRVADWHHASFPCDVDASSIVSPLDALLIINELNEVGSYELPARSADSTEPFFDVSGDGSVSPFDALLVINVLNQTRDPMVLVAGLAPTSDRNGNGVVLSDEVVVNGQSLPGVRIGVTNSLLPAPSDRVTADETGHFSLAVNVAAGLQTLTFVAQDDVGRSINFELTVRRGDVIHDWNAAALDVVRDWSTLSNDPYEGRIVPSQPPRVARNLAMIHAAMFDAANSVDHAYEPYLLQLSAGPGARADVAAAAAARRVAGALYTEPDERAVWEATWLETLTQVPDDFDATSSVAVGEAVADAVLAARANDGSVGSVVYTPQLKPGFWNRTAPGFLPPTLPHWPHVTPFALTSAAQFRPEAPPALDTPAYAQAVDQVMRLGSYGSHERTNEQTQIALFWADGGGTATPPGHWNRIATDVSLARNDTVVENARTFALLNIALADAGIACWDAKYEFDFWRPIDAIRRADIDGNAETSPVVDWMPLIDTPPFPSYTSGHSTFSGAAAAVLTSIYGDNLSFTSEIDSHDSPAQRPLGQEKIFARTFANFWEAANEASISRVYGGIHFEFDSTAGLTLGRAVGEFVGSTILQPPSK